MPSTTDYIQQPDPLPVLQQIPNFWWIAANQKHWMWETLFTNPYQGEFFHKRKILDNFNYAKPGDVVFGYQSSPEKKMVALAVVCRSLYYNWKLEHYRKDPYGIDILGFGQSMLQFPVEWTLLKIAIPNSEPVRCNSQGTLFRLTPSEALGIARLLRKAGNKLEFPESLQVVEEYLHQ